jgi:hypothetical protein
MSDQKEGKWLPYNQDGSVHECKAKTKNGNGNGNNNDISVQILLKRLQSIGIIIDLEKLRNAKI